MLHRFVLSHPLAALGTMPWLTVKESPSEQPC
jgi:hypothetical protein